MEGHRLPLRFPVLRGSDGRNVLGQGSKAHGMRDSQELEAGSSSEFFQGSGGHMADVVGQVANALQVA